MECRNLGRLGRPFFSVFLLFLPKNNRGLGPYKANFKNMPFALVNISVWVGPSSSTSGRV